MTAPALVVLAAGLGTRYGALKLQEPVGPDGDSLVEYSLYDAHRAGFGRVIFVIRREMEQPLLTLAQKSFVHRFHYEYVFQDVTKIPAHLPIPRGRTRPWGTTHAVLVAAQCLHEPFGVINATDFYGARSFASLANHLNSGSQDHAVLGFTLRNTLSDFGAVARGICELSQDGHLSDIVEMKRVEREKGHAISIGPLGEETLLTGNETVSMNMWGFHLGIVPLLREQFTRFFQHCGDDPNAECYLPVTVGELLRGQQIRVKVLHSVDNWFGLTYREDYPRAVEKLRHLVDEGQYPRRLWAEHVVLR